MCWLSANSGISVSWSHKGLPRPIQGLPYLYSEGRADVESVTEQNSEENNETQVRGNNRKKLHIGESQNLPSSLQVITVSNYER
jgi:hypothetical protein